LEELKKLNSMKNWKMKIVSSSKADPNGASTKPSRHGVRAKGGQN
jgi:hypothetical protein